MLLLSCGERPSQHRHGRLGSLQFGSRGRTDGGGGTAAAGAFWAAAVTRVFLGLGLTNLEAVNTCFWELSRDWLSGGRGCSPTLVLVGAAGALTGRRGDAILTVLMFFSSFWKPGLRDFGPANAVVRLVRSKRRDFEGRVEQLEDCIVGFGLPKNTVIFISTQSVVVVCV